MNSAGVEYLLIGGYAVGYHGYPRATGDMDIWIATDLVNAEKVVEVMEAFGFDVPELTPALFMAEGRIVRMGLPPFRLEVLTSISGVDFDTCYAQRIVGTIDGVEISIIDLENLKANKRASGRAKDLDDLLNLP